MSFQDRQSQFPNQRKLKIMHSTNSVIRPDDEIIAIVERDEGTISVQGDAINAANLNKLLDKTQELDIAVPSVASNTRAYSSSLTKSQLSNFTNPTLLINGDFRINQRGQSSYTSTTNKYGADRWRNELCHGMISYVAKNDYVYKATAVASQYPYLEQRIEYDFSNDVGKTLTASCCVEVIGTGLYEFGIRFYPDEFSTNMKTTATQIVSNEITKVSSVIPNGCKRICAIFRVINQQVNDLVKHKWVKLEFGSVATPFNPRPYAEELALCKRYYQIFKGALGLGNLYLDGSGLVLIKSDQFSVEMRVSPTINIYSPNSTDKISCRVKNTYYDLISANATERYKYSNGKSYELWWNINWLSGYEGSTVEMFTLAGGYISFDAEM